MNVACVGFAVDPRLAQHNLPFIQSNPGCGLGGDLFFASVGQMRVSVNNALAGIRPQVKNLLLDFSSVNFIDVSACDELLTFIEKLQNQGVTIAFARVRDESRLS